MDGIAIGDLALLGYLAPLSLIMLALVASLNLVRSVDLTFQIGRAIGAGSFLLMLALGVVVFTFGPMVSPLIGAGEAGIALRLDALSVMMSWLVTLLGTLLIQFSRNYLDGDPRQKLFFIRLSLTIGATLQSLAIDTGVDWREPCTTRTAGVLP